MIRYQVLVGTKVITNGEGSISDALRALAFVHEERVKENAVTVQDDAQHWTRLRYAGKHFGINPVTETMIEYPITATHPLQNVLGDF